jgi:mRNA interferase RelE/StbE
MEPYQIEWKPSAVRELKRLDGVVAGRIIRAVDSLAVIPFPPGARRLRGSRQSYRIRVGDYRVIYEVFQSRLLIEIVRVRHRRDAYR